MSNERGHDTAAMVALVEMWERPIVVCLCGSTRFSEAFQAANLRETLEGRIVLSIGCDMRSDTEIFGGMPQSELDDIKRRLDDLHKRKIDLADEILVLNVGGYVGESTSSEIAYAKAHGKTIRYLETTGGLPTQPGETPDMATPASEPAPAPAPRLDTPPVELPVMMSCPACHGTGTFRGTGVGTCGGCDGDAFHPRTIRLTDEALDRLAGELAKRLARDLGRLEYNIRLASQAIHDAGALSTDQTENIVCVALNQIDVALHALYDAVRALADTQQSGK